MSKRRNFIIARSKRGVLYKRYYNVVRDEQGLSRTEFYHSKRLNLPERLLYKYTSYYDEQIRGRKKRSISKLPYFALATLLAGSVLVGGIWNSANGDQSFDNPMYSTTSPSTPTTTTPTQSTQPTTIPEATTESTSPTQPEIPTVAPIPDTYEQNGKTFISLDSSLEISRYNYANLVKELEAYNSSVPENQRYDFDADMFDHAIFTGAHIQENSLIIFSQNNPNYRGGFQIGKEAMEEANEIAINLTGKPIVTDVEQLDDPVLSNKACMYIYIKNYQYLQDHIDRNNLDVTITPEMVIDTYLYGCGNIMRELSGSGYEQKIYSMNILSYADIVRDFSDALFIDGISGDERASARRNTFLKLYEVPAINKALLAEREAEKGAEKADK